MATLPDPLVRMQLELVGGSSRRPPVYRVYDPTTASWAEVRAAKSRSRLLLVLVAVLVVLSLLLPLLLCCCR